MRKKYLNNFLFAALTVIGLFGLFLIAFNPCFNTDVDIFFLYTLSGGYGNSPSPILHYADIFHPILSNFLAAIFNAWPNFNWYSLFLILFHFCSCVILLQVLLDYFNRVYAIAVFSIFFLFVECQLLLQFNFSGAALTGAISGSTCLLLNLMHFGVKRSSRKLLLVFSLMIVAGGLLRIHYVFLFSLFICWMGLFFLKKKEYICLLAIHIFISILLVLLFQGQRYYFQNRIPDWEKEEKLRQASFYYSNRPHKESFAKHEGIKKLKQDLISINFLYDTTLITEIDVREFGEENTTNLLAHKGSPRRFYWFFIELRVYLLLLIVLTLILLLANKKKVPRLIFIWSFYIVVFAVLFLFFKITVPILAATLTPILLAFSLSLNEVYLHKKWIRMAGIFLIVLVCSWMFIRIIKMNEFNEQQIHYARSVADELGKHKNILFVDSGSHFDFHFSIWDTPAQYPIYNLIYNELFFSNTYKLQITRFGIADLPKEIVYGHNIYLVGPKVSLLLNYYSYRYGEVVTAEKVAGFKYSDVYKMKLVDPKQ